jgi:signal transduction histidine kinase
MRRLGKLTAGRSVWWLPLSEYAAGAVAESFLHNDLARRQQQLVELLAVEAPLVLWCVCRGERWQTAPPDSIEALAQWLALHGLHLLQWSEDELQLRQVDDRGQVQRWAQLAVESVEVAQSASRLVDAEDPRQLYLLALLHGAAQWLECTGPAITLEDCKPGNTFLPQWLVQFLRELDDVPPRSFRARAVAQAISRLPAGSNGTPQPDGSTDPVRATDSIPSGDSLRSRWLEPEARVGSLLPILLQKLARLRELEGDFQKTLETEKLESLKALAYGASHEINNPLANISTRAQTLLREETDPERRRKLAVINSQAFRAHELIADMMLFARPPELRPTAVNLTGLVDEVIAEIALEAEDQGTTIQRVTSDDPLIATADGGHLAVALRALCANSLEALGSGGRIEIFAQPAVPPEDSDGQAWVEILVSDTGPGIPREAWGHLFDPYFSGREAGRGLGLGLSKSWRIVNEHGGRIDVDSHPERGTTFAIRLPRDRNSVLHSGEAACPTAPTVS